MNVLTVFRIRLFLTKCKASTFYRVSDLLLSITMTSFVPSIDPQPVWMHSAPTLTFNNLQQGNLLFVKAQNSWAFKYLPSEDNDNVKSSSRVKKPVREMLNEDGVTWRGPITERTSFATSTSIFTVIQWRMHTTHTVDRWRIQCWDLRWHRIWLFDFHGFLLLV